MAKRGRDAKRLVGADGYWGLVERVSQREFPTSLLSLMETLLETPETH